MEDKYFRLLEELYPLHRTLVSDDMDRAMDMITDFLRGQGVPEDQVRLHQFASGSELSTWIAPQKYALRDFRLTELGATKRVIVDSTEIPLTVAEYSQPVDEIMDWEELEKHLYTSERRPGAIPFVFRHFYRPGYGFCIRKRVYDTLDRNGRFHAYIASELTDGFLKCLEVLIPGEVDESILVMSNVCHPYQVNDSITGAINNLMLIEHFLNRKNHYTLRFGFWPETIGAQAYFSKYIDEKPLFKYAIFTEMLGTAGRHSLQLSRQETSLIDRVALHVLDKRRKLEFVSGRYTTVARNDERISNGPNLDIPTISLTRWPYEEYHTSDDDPSIIDMRNLRESSEVVRQIIKIVDEDSTLVPGDFFGQPFLTRYGLFHDFQSLPPEKNLNKIMEDVFSYSDGLTSLFEIADRFGYEWETVRKLADGLLGAELFRCRDRG